MATKKECDRCRKQWDAHVSDSSYDAQDIETCEIAFSIPEARATKIRGGYTNRPKIRTKKELCQDCARYIWDLITNVPNSVEAD